MFWDDTKDLLFLVIVTLLSIIPLLRELFALPKKQSKKTKKPVSYLIFLSSCFIFIIILGWDKLKRDKTRDVSIEQISKNMNELLIKTKQDSVFEKKVFDKFHIQKDSMNEPHLINKGDTYNTNIDNVKDLHIGPNNE